MNEEGRDTQSLYRKEPKIYPREVRGRFDTLAMLP